MGASLIFFLGGHTIWAPKDSINDLVSFECHTESTKPEPLKNIYHFNNLNTTIPVFLQLIQPSQGSTHQPLGGFQW